MTRNKLEINTGFRSPEIVIGPKIALTKAVADDCKPDRLIYSSAAGVGASCIWFPVGKTKGLKCSYNGDSLDYLQRERMALEYFWKKGMAPKPKSEVLPCVFVVNLDYLDCDWIEEEPNYYLRMMPHIATEIEGNQYIIGKTFGFFIQAVQPINAKEFKSKAFKEFLELFNEQHIIHFGDEFVDLHVENFGKIKGKYVCMDFGSET